MEKKFLSKRTLRLSPAKIIALGFVLIILLGATLLSLPISNKDGRFLGFIDALFTATSATCVTGLVIADTYRQFTFLGQLVILCLIQVGGLGFMTFAILIPLFLGRRIGLMERRYLMEALGPLHIGGVVRLTKRILYGTLFFECLGAFLLALRFVPRFGWSEGLWFSVFHSISAFCNAGFDLMGIISPYSSLVHYYNDPLICMTIMSLIVIGGIGFVVWEDLAINKFNFSKYSLHSKVVLTTTSILIVVGTLLFLQLEWSSTMKDMPFGTKVLCSLFQSVTTRTAGFNTVDTAALSEGGNLLTNLLMIIGAAPGSTGGGIKVSTMAVIVITILAQARSREDVDVYKRRLEQDVIRRAFVSTALYISMALLVCLGISIFQDLAMKDIMFEALSAIGTVGLSTGITRELTIFSRLLIIILMYAGRVGSLTVFVAVAANKVNKLRFPTDKIIVG